MISDILFINHSAVVLCAVINQPDLCKLALKGALYSAFRNKLSSSILILRLHTLNSTFTCRFTSLLCLPVPGKSIKCRHPYIYHYSKRGTNAKVSIKYQILFNN